MARITKPLTNTEIERAKPKEKEYTLSDGQGLYLLSLVVHVYGDLIIISLLVILERECY